MTISAPSFPMVASIGIPMASTIEASGWKLVYAEKYKTLSETRKREYYLKSLKSRVAIEKLIKQAPFV